MHSHVGQQPDKSRAARAKPDHSSSFLVQSQFAFDSFVYIQGPAVSIGPKALKTQTQAQTNADADTDADRKAYPKLWRAPSLLPPKRCSRTSMSTNMMV